MDHVAQPDPVNSLLTLQFEGPTLEQHSLAIYDLSVSLIAVQRMLQKAYLLQQGNEETSLRTLTNEDRERTALRLAGRRRGSDIYDLLPFLTDPLAQNIMGELVVMVLGALGTYAFRRLRPRRTQNDSPLVDDGGNRTLVAMIYPDVNDLLARLGNFGGALSLKVSGPPGSTLPNVVLNLDTKTYVRDVAAETVLGESQTLTGNMTDLNITHKHVQIRTASGASIRVYVSVDHLTRMRYEAPENAQFRFRGRPVYRLGSSSTFSEFEADEVAWDQP